MIDIDDHTKQEKVYTRNGKGKWRVIGYCPEHSITMENIGTGEQSNFGVNGAANSEFCEIQGARVSDIGVNTVSLNLPMSRSMLKIKDLQEAIAEIEKKMKFRLCQKGGRTYASVHEAYGIIAEEHKELLDAIHGNEGHDAVVEELKDIAVACIVSISSIRSGSVHW